MRTKILILISFVFIVLGSTSQNDTLNQYNAKGKKTGYWLRYLDQNLSPVDSVESYFYGYEFYDDGHAVFIYSKDWWLKNSRLISISHNSKKGNPVLLEGTFKWFVTSDSLPFSVEIYENGYPVNMYAYHQCADHPWHVSEFLDFKKRYENQRGSFYFEMEKGEVLKKYWMRKENGKWKGQRIKEQPVADK